MSDRKNYLETHSWKLLDLFIIIILLIASLERVFSDRYTYIVVVINVIASASRFITFLSNKTQYAGADKDYRQ